MTAPTPEQITTMPPGSAFLSCRVQLEHRRSMPDGAHIFDALVCRPYAADDTPPIACSLSFRKTGDSNLCAGTYDIFAKVCRFQFF